VRGDAIPGVEVHIGPVAEPWADPGRYPDFDHFEVHVTLSDADGRFSFETPFPTASWISLTLRPPPHFMRDGRNFGPAGGRDERPLHPGENDLGTFVLPDAAAVEGRVVFETGTPAARAVVGVEGIYPNGLAVSRRADDDGNFVLGGVPAGTFRVSVKRCGFRAECEVNFILGVTSGPIELMLPSASTVGDEGGMTRARRSAPRLSIRIVDAISGEPVTRFSLTTRDPWEETRLEMSDHPEGTVDMPVGYETDSILVDAPGYGSRDVVVDGIDRRLVFEIGLMPESILTGRVLAGAEPESEALIRIEAAVLPVTPANLENDDLMDDDGDTDVDGRVGQPRQVLPDPDGAFRIGSLPEGHWLLTVFAPDSAPLSRSVCISSPGETDLGDLILTRGGTIAGIVHLPADMAGADWRVGLDSGPRADEGVRCTLDRTRTFRFDFVSPGPHLLFVADIFGHAPQERNWPVTAEEGTVSEIVLDLAR